MRNQFKAPFVVYVPLKFGDKEWSINDTKILPFFSYSKAEKYVNEEGHLEYLNYGTEDWHWDDMHPVMFIIEEIEFLNEDNVKVKEQWLFNQYGNQLTEDERVSEVSQVLSYFS